MSNADASGQARTAESISIGDLIVKWLPLVLSALAAVLSVISFVAKYTFEAKKPYLEYQLNTYKQAIQTAQTLAIEDIRDSAAWKANTTRFWMLYWGEMGLVESPEVARAMIDIGNCLKDSECNDLRSRSLQLSYKMRDSIAQSWSVSDSIGLPKNEK